MYSKEVTIYAFLSPLKYLMKLKCKINERNYARVLNQYHLCIVTAIFSVRVFNEILSY